MALPPPPKAFTGLPPAWTDWFRHLQREVGVSSGGTFNGLDFTGSNITSIATRLHNSLQTIQGGSAGDYNHLTTAQVALVTGALQTPGANGILVRTSGTTTVNRSLTAPAAGLTISNNDGVSGNPTFALANDLAALEGLTGTGVATRTGADTWALDSTFTTGPGSSTDNAIVRWNGTGGTAIQNSGVVISDNGEILAASGGTADAPIKLQSGTNLTTAEAGALEYDGKKMMFTPLSVERGVVPAVQFVIVDSDYTLTSGTTAQAVFPGAYDTITVSGSTMYFFDAVYFITNGTVAHTTEVLFAGTATFTFIRYYSLGHTTAANTGTATQTSGWSTAVTGFNVLASSGNAGKAITLRGVFSVNAGGTIIPQIRFGTDPTGTNLTKAGSYFRIYPVGVNTIASLGNWG